MPTSKSATKRVRTTARKAKRNKVSKDALKDAIKDFEAAVEENNVELAEEKLNEAKKVIDKSVTKGILHKNNAARKKSKLERKFNEIAS
ncbi:MULTISPECIES: 30S ribosomal protein S20 [unclassified Candidatus Frackibacter]|uniref:30S ribosomal protein S20 n=1 Tax=unclassified Candidatus Frackibacter TaxID=2648818 RepID=UPI0008849B47|nr:MULTISPECIES: 30S ribosomal protein S20 [unclassified Candidatus Frackibacter]SDC73603.1 small subunit ribosomal protein S20 [Candidatus Frackibacter sp. WG11]SEM87745.1 small subunit ribosomal protein S20 [Candidatus Frackibacter sp. WG12]SFL96936.1 small subunit ribosomal protein S20 [Candidatus Frackibacter sp. WG13]